ncbi:uncharacterized protein V1516DRAFT_677568 [Lipomyces oligophaga]|uniref:uncharacterized protein n=1 Tax=Lipomyces oligophaga TaxID=45792 RepID=UPI0034CFE074
MNENILGKRNYSLAFGIDNYNYTNSLVSGLESLRSSLPLYCYKDGSTVLNCEALCHYLDSKDFSQLDLSAKLRILRAISYLPCARAVTIRNNGDIYCIQCNSQYYRGPYFRRNSWIEIYKVIDQLIALNFKINDEKWIVGILAAIRHYLLHFIYSDSVADLRSTSLFKFCIESMSNNSRSVRMMASRALPWFISDFKSSQAVFSKLTDLPQFPQLVETSIICWSEIAKIVHGENLNVALLKLIAFFDSNDVFTVSLVIHEIRSIARFRRLSTLDLLSPFWETISISLFKHQKSHQFQTIEIISELLNVDLDCFLDKTKDYIIPFLVWEHRKDDIKRIAEILGVRAASLCRGSICQIMATFLLNSSNDPISDIQVSLMKISSTFSKVDESFVRLNSIVVSVELLKMYREEDDSKLDHEVSIFESMTFLSNLDRQDVQADDLSNLYLFMSKNILGIICRFSDVLYKSPHWPEKQHYLKGLGATVRLARDCAGDFKLQVCSILQTTITDSDLQESTLLVWKTMIQYFPLTEVISLLGLSMSLILFHWKSFSPRSEVVALVVLQTLVDRLKNSEPHLRSSEIPSQYNHIAKLRGTIGVLRSLMLEPTSDEQRLSDIIVRCRSENFSIVHEALLELRKLLLESQFHDSTIPSILSAISNNTAGILQVCIRATQQFFEGHPRIAKLAAECIGLVGCEDLSEFKQSTSRTDILLFTNFDAKEENDQFICFLLDFYIVPAFVSSADPKYQLFLAYAMQQLLEISGMSPTSVKIGGFAYGTWSAFSEISKITLLPFLSSRYELTRREDEEASEVQDCIDGHVLVPLSGYPLFTRTPDHRSWLREFTYECLCRAALIQKKNNLVRSSQNIFLVISKAISVQDPRVSNVILPFVVQYLIVHGSEEERGAIAIELNQVLSDRSKFSLNSEQHETETQIERTDIRLSYETVFSILDYCSRWLRIRRKANGALIASSTKRTRRPIDPVPVIREDDATTLTESTLSQIKTELVATRALESQSYARALFYNEQALRNLLNLNRTAGDSLDKAYSQLQQIYSQLGDSDSVLGMSTMILSSNLENQKLEHESLGRWDLALKCYEIDNESSELDKQLLREYNIIKCLRNLNDHDALLNRMNVTAEREKSLAINFAIESAWTLGRWKNVAEWIKNAPKPSFETYVGQSLLSIQTGDLLGVYKAISEGRSQLANNIALSGSSSLKQTRNLIFQLQAFSHIEEIYLSGLRGKDNMSNLHSRMEKFKGSYPETRYMLTLQQAVISLDPANTRAAADIWLLLAQKAYKAHYYDQAYGYCMQASRYSSASKFALFELAKLQWIQGDQKQALRELDTLLQTRDFLSADGLPDNLFKAKMQLKYAKWFDRSNQGKWSEVLLKYATVTETTSSLESGYYHYGKYCVKIIEAQTLLPEDKRNSQYIKGKYHVMAVNAYCEGLVRGVKHVYQTLPKLLTLWLLLADPKANEGGQQRDLKKNIDELTGKIKSTFASLPKYIFFPVLSQIISRIRGLEQDSTVFKIIRDVLTQVGLYYPSQSFWQILALSLGRDAERVKFGKPILRHLRSRSVGKFAAVKDIVSSASRLLEALDWLCGVRCDANTSFDLRRLFRQNFDKNLDVDRLFTSDLIVPVQRNMTIVWPSKLQSLSDEEHTPFAHKVTIHKISDIVDVMGSMQRPKKLKFIGTDGKYYTILCKPGDDLRKDARLLEFNDMINKLLQKEDESSKRNLEIMTYAVVVLTEDTGLIEWVDNTRTVRDIIRAGYSARNISFPVQILREMLDTKKHSRQERSQTFTDKILPMFPPVLYEWFIENFPVPSSWLESRTSFARTAAVMSIVGYILGLGDRHSDNILCDEETGKILHVDYSCLFEKGLELEIPECVPFRLTQNIVDALGPYGYEGPFRKCCEITLQILRQHQEVLLPFLETFLYDPIVDWKRKKGPSPKGPSEALTRIKQRLDGQVVTDSFALGVEAQVDMLIKEATDPGRLSSMYIGWCSMW